LIDFLAYVDDTVPTAPSWDGLQYLLDTAEKQNEKTATVLNTLKSVSMVFPIWNC